MVRLRRSWKMLAKVAMRRKRARVSTGASWVRGAVWPGRKSAVGAGNLGVCSGGHLWFLRD